MIQSFIDLIYNVVSRLSIFQKSNANTNCGLDCFVTFHIRLKRFVEIAGNLDIIKFL